MTRIERSVSGTLMVALLSACTMQGAPSIPKVAQSQALRTVRTAATEPLLYVSDPVDDSVKVYRAAQRNPSPIATIRKGIRGPAGLAIDGSGNLYVASTTGNTVTEYHRNALSPVATYAKDLLGPVSVAVDDAGTLYVANFDSFVYSIVEFPAGTTDPSVTIRNPCGCYPIGLAIDGGGNLYVAYDDFYSQSLVYRYAPGSTKGIAVNLQLGSTHWEAAGMTFDAAANLLVANATLPGIQVFASGSTTATDVFGKRGSPRFLQLAADERHAFVSDTAARAVEEYTYPAGKPAGTVARGLKSAYGLAISPRAPL